MLSIVANRWVKIIIKEGRATVLELQSDKNIMREMIMEM